MCRLAHADAQPGIDHVGVKRYRTVTRNALVVVVLVLVLLAPLAGLLPSTAFALSFAIPVTEKTIHCAPGTDFGCNGGSKAEKFEGTIGTDAIFAGGNIDYALGHRGEDVIYGGGGGDMLVVVRDRDYMFGNDGHDYLDGGLHDDYLQGGLMIDSIFGLLRTLRLPLAGPTAMMDAVNYSQAQ